MLTRSVVCLGLFNLCISARTVVAFWGDPSQYFGGVENEAYVNWVNGKKNDAANWSSAYFNASSSDVTQGAAVHWKVDDANQELYVAVAARAEGWVGLGLAEAGGMKGSDIVYYEVANPNKLTDAHVLFENVKPITDTCQQDWTYINATVEGGFLIFEGKRKFVTGDSQDQEIFNDEEVSVPAQRLIVAWGDTDSISFHGPTKTARGAVRWYSDGDVVTRFHERMLQQADGFVDIRVPNFTIPSNTTTYMDFCTNWVDLVAQGINESARIVTVIGAEVILTPAARHLVHHANIYSSSQTIKESRTCLESGLSAYSTILYSYAPGELPFVLPENVGYYVGPEGLSQSFRLQVHYNNALNEEGIVDNGGIRAYYVYEKRDMELGIAVFADAIGIMEGTSLPGGVSSYAFDCPSNCSTLGFEGENVTVLAAYFHMHEAGLSAMHQVIRNGQVFHTSQVKFWDFTQSSLMPVRQNSFQLQPGDAFRTKFFYNNSEGNLIFGIESSNEMGNIALLYYPAKRLSNGVFPWACVYNVPFIPACDASLTLSVEQERVLRDERGFELDQCPSDGDDGGIDSGDLKSTAALGFFMIAAAMVWI